MFAIMYHRAILLLLLCTVSWAQRPATRDPCDSGGLRRFDATVAKLITIGNSGRKFPETKGQDLKVFCEQSFEYISEIEEYRSKCMVKLPKQVTGVLVYAVKNAIKQYCKKDSKRLTELIYSTPCINKADSEFTKCHAKLIDSFQGARYANESKRIPHICCEYFKIYECFHDRTKRYPICTSNRVEHLADFIKSIFNNMVDLICGDNIDGSDKCDKLESPPRKKKSDKRTKSFAVPLIQVLDSFPEI